eukprot:gnl/MRDRNA2_/MRDRNA2_87581_c0_seq1.p1 gnl/MRDRNA2_/MRDRNA2_87581_c0~~gnl/MRDRNA2_/MRDRNA2_87581_c0_seq1.p1  ORF type:complete len:705 (-),score=242.88 gnl/MRDRNA2_/MRDRNA2_87581_c0_seq1:33-2147(-)
MSQMTLALLIVGVAFAPCAADLADKPNAVRKVITLIEEMKVQVEKEGDEDKKAYDAYACWCKTNDEEKTAAIANAEKQIEDLTSAIEGFAALKAQLTTEIEKLEQDIADATKALETAAAQREKEAAEFRAQEKDMKDALSALHEAIEVLSKVQLLQKSGKGQTPQVGQMLIQVQNIVMHSNLHHYRDVLQSDLWDFLSSANTFLPKQSLSALSTEQDPIPGGGAAAGAKSYNSRSGQIFGILSQMKDEFGKDLTNAQKEELRAMITFHNLKAAKQMEIDAATKMKDAKSAELAKATQDDAQAKQDLEDTQAAMSSDQKFLLELKKNCKIADEEYAARAKVRGDELVALGEALKILTSDESRDLWGKTMSFLQIQSVDSSHGRSATQAKARGAAVKRLLQVAKRTKNWQLATLAVSAQLDSFTKVKEAMDKMLAELKKQQAEEYEKNDFCKKEIDANEDSTKVKTHEKNDLEDLHTELETQISVLTKEIESLNQEIGEMQVSLKRAGEDRKAENIDFQAQVADQRAVVNILNKVLARLKMFYEKKSFAQVNAHNHQEPGAAVEPPPPKPKEYSKSAGAGGVMQLIAMIIEDAQKEEAELVVDEQNSQEAYASFVQETNNCLAACEQSITEKTETKSAAESSKSETEASLLAVNQELASLKELNIGLHKDCDFLLENFEIRQTARKEEMDAIVEAKAILSGADFGL